jgi:SAM-dependent methyltransferase
MQSDNTKERERDEIRRSELEVARLGDSSLRIDAGTIARYANPSADTCFPNEYLFYLLGDVRGKTVLDFGCGDGEHSCLLASRGARVVAMDISLASIRRIQLRIAANTITTDMERLVGSGHFLPLKNESVDVVFGAAVLHHLDLSLAAPEVRRVLRKGGRAIFREPVRNSRLIRSIRRLIPYQGSDVSPHERPLTDAELDDFAMGYSRFTSRSFALPYVSVARVVPFLRRLEMSLLRMDAKVLKMFPALSYYATQRVIEMVK